MLFNASILIIDRYDSRQIITFVSLASILIACVEFFLRKGKTSIAFGAKNLWGWIYIGLPLALACLFVSDFEKQRSLLLGFFILQWATDTFAYLVGSKWGKHKMLPAISPKKSWEGFIGAGILIIPTAFLLSHFLNEIPLDHWMVMALIVWFFGAAGDFFESRFKRHYNIKDSGSFLPGHGGFLDRFDGVLYSLPVVSWYLNFVVL